MIAPGIQEEILPLDMLRAGEAANIVEFTVWPKWVFAQEHVFAWCAAEPPVC